MRTARIAMALIVLSLSAAACGDGEAGEDQDVSLTVYSGRDEEFIGPLYERFEDETGIDLEVRYGDSAELAATILEEGEASPADVFVSQDAGALGVVADQGLLSEIDPEILDRVDERFRSPEGLWVGASGRARVIAYNTETVSESELPTTVLDLAGPAYEGRVGFPPTNASFQAFVAAMIITEGEDATRSFLQGLADNDPRLFESNSDTVRAVAAGEVDFGLVNHYYRYEVEAEDGPIPVENHFLAGGDPGALVNAAGAGVLASSDAPDASMRLLDFLTGEEGQRYFATETFEYPVVPGIEPGEDLPPLAEIESPSIDLSDLGATLEPALRLLAEVGLL
ncbi:MAG TPA: iron ABC transporter substrate-binding protein [Actinomycetota bacterium]